MVIFKAKDYLSELDLIIKNKIDKLETDKKLYILVFGKNPIIDKFVSIKIKVAEQLGIGFEIINFKSSAKKSEVVSVIHDLNTSRDCGGIVLQYPFSSKFAYEDLAPIVSPEKDVDFFNPDTYGRFALSYNPDFMPPTVRALDFILNTYKLELKGHRYLVVGQGVLVGRPVAAYLLNREVTLISANEYTEDLHSLIKDADVVITGTGVPNLIKASDLKRGASLIDFSSGSIENPDASDFDPKSNFSHLNVVSLSPGGVGPLTVRYLLLNFLEFIELSEKK